MSKDQEAESKATKPIGALALALARTTMNSLPEGYSLRYDGLYEKAVHFGKKGAATEILVRDKSGRLIKVIREEHHQNRSRRKASIQIQ